MVRNKGEIGLSRPKFHLSCEVESHEVKFEKMCGNVPVRKEMTFHQIGFMVRGDKGVEVSHLRFADDIIILCEGSQDQMIHISWLFMWSKVILKLKINLEKSELILIGRVVNVEEITCEIGCKVGELLSIYLDLPLSSHFKLVVAGDGVEECFHKGLAMW